MFCRQPIGSAKMVGPWSKVFVEQKKWRRSRARRTRKLEEGNEFADHAKIYNAEHGKYSSAPIEVIDASVPPAPVTLHPERSPSPAAHCQSIPDAKANFSFPNRVAAPKKMDFVAHRSKFLWRIAASEGVGVQLKFP